jgi:hypothetical protein
MQLRSRFRPGAFVATQMYPSANIKSWERGVEDFPLPPHPSLRTHRPDTLPQSPELSVCEIYNLENVSIFDQAGLARPK